MVKVNIFFGLRLVACMTIIPSFAIYTHAKRPLVKTDYSYTYMHQPEIPEHEHQIRNINFIVDIGDMVELDLLAQKPSYPNKPELTAQDLHYLTYFKEIPITVKAEKEYRVKNGDAITIETKHSWELCIPKISNDALLSLNTLRGIVLDHFMDHFVPKALATNFMQEWVCKPMLSFYQKFVAPFVKIISRKEATTTIVILTDIEPHYENISFLDIMLDLEKLNTEDKLEKKFSHDDEGSMRVTISPKRYKSSPNTFF